MEKTIYLDYMSTTPVDPRVMKKMMNYLDATGCFGNPAAVQHIYGWEASEQIEEAREKVAALIHADRNEIIWTSGATESNNLAIKGGAEFYARKGKHIVTMATEHKAVLGPCHFLASQGFEISYLKPKENGLLDLEQLKSALRDDTILVSIMHVNSETGVIQDIEKIGAILRDRGIIFHVDAAQSAGKIPIDVKQMHVNLMSLSGHKVYGPKGIGALYICKQPRLHLVPQIHGGSHEEGMRAGTLATHQIVGMAEAFAIAAQEMEQDSKRIFKLREKLCQGLQKIPGVRLNGDSKQRISGCLNVYIEGVEGESLMVGLNRLAFSSRSACNSASVEPSHVLLAMGLSREIAQHSLRLSLGRFTTENEIEQVITEMTEQVERLRRLSPLWEVAKQQALKKSR